MVNGRWLSSLGCVFGLLACTACGPRIPIPVHDAQPRQVGVITPKRSEFASYPTTPGQTVSLHAGPVEPYSPPAPPKTSQIDISQTPADIALPALPDVKPPKDELTPLTAALDDFQKNKTESAVKHLEAFDKPNQELLLQLIPTLVQVSRLNLMQPDAEETATLAKQFESAAAIIAKRAKLTVRKTVLCDSVKSFGLYTPVNDTQSLMRGTTYLLYVEVGNVPSALINRTDGDWYQTKLDCSMQVKDDTGTPLEIVNVKNKDDGPRNVIKETKSELTRSAIHDYYIRSQFDTPSRPGLYSVSFEVRDPRTGQSVSKSISFRVP
jgi:hypothetical protein